MRLAHDLGSPNKDGVSTADAVLSFRVEILQRETSETFEFETSDLNQMDHTLRNHIALG